MAKAGIYIGSTQIHNVGLVTGDTYETVNAIKEQIQGKTGETYGNLSEAVQDVLAPYGNNENAVAKIIKSNNTEVEYTSVYAALNDVISGETIQMIANSIESTTTIPSGVTLDLNGYVLTTNLVLSFGNVVDNSEGKTAKIKAPMDTVKLAENNAQMPIWNNVDGYLLAEVIHQCIPTSLTNGVKLVYKPKFVPTDTIYSLLSDGAADNNLEFSILTKYDKNETYEKHEFVTPENSISSIYTNNKAFSFTINDIDDLSNLRISIVIKSITGVVSSELVYQLNTTE